MVFRLLELAIGREVGFAFFTFLWDDNSTYSLLAFVHSDQHNTTYCSILLYSFLIDWNEDEEDL